MELALSLGETTPTTPFSFLHKAQKITNNSTNLNNNQAELGFCMSLGNSAFSSRSSSSSDQDHQDKKDHDLSRPVSSSSDLQLPLQLDLLPSAPVPRSQTTSQLRFPWLTDNCTIIGPGKGFDVNRLPAVGAVPEETEDGITISSPNSTLSSFHMDFCVRSSSSGGVRTSNKRDHSNNNMECETERASSRASDDEENGSTRKKLRLSKEQSAFLEESFKEHSTLNPKQKVALAKQLNLRPRQVEVWFQNRRARTKLKQTEVDCEYLKRCCETLTDENRRLQKELQELRALKTSQPFYMQLPATTLTMCPSCERVATAGTGTAAGSAANSGNPSPHRFSHGQVGKGGS
ncbi:homeobox-leucine zipper protein HAT14-like isoform X2 [Humulus lupulus]|uniref:homeobox-leucine zipper protein HAT14-like isoform X2 n=1 Tax=Humulus lupulus TaxID=3486 RepID=UPI002B409972|nr:homeobox-leucine zipper protein HAT14-like isoform X2 [Humulus lupulus]